MLKILFTFVAGALFSAAAFLIFNTTADTMTKSSSKCARDYENMDLYTGSSVRCSESGSEVTKNILHLPSATWSEKYGLIDKKLQPYHRIEMVFMQRWCDGKQVNATPAGFNIPDSIYRHDSWSPSKKIAMLKQYHNELNSIDPRPRDALFTKWMCILSEKEPSSTNRVKESLPVP